MSEDKSAEKMASEARWEKFEKALVRLGCLLPMTLWPVMFWIQSFGQYSTGRHSAEALNAVGNQVFMLAHVFTLVGMLMVILGRADTTLKVVLCILLVLHFFALFFYILGSAVAYA